MLFKSGSLRRHRDSSGGSRGNLDDGGGGGASGNGQGSGVDSGDQLDPPHRLRRVFTTHACRRRPNRPEVNTAGHASPLQWRMKSFMKKPLGIAHSVPLGAPLNFNRFETWTRFFFVLALIPKTLIVRTLKLSRAQLSTLANVSRGWLFPCSNAPAIDSNFISQQQGKSRSF